MNDNSRIVEFAIVGKYLLETQLMRRLGLHLGKKMIISIFVCYRSYGEKLLNQARGTILLET